MCFSCRKLTAKHTQAGELLSALFFDENRIPVNWFISDLDTSMRATVAALWKYIRRVLERDRTKFCD